MENYNPRIYVADLSAYNDGRLVGEWIDLKDFESGEEVMQEIATLLKKWSKLSGEVREEFAIHDYEYIPESLASEYMSEADFDAIYRLLEVSEEYNLPAPVLAKAMSDKGETDPEAVAENYIGTADSYEDFVFDYVNNDISAFFNENYFDTDSYGSDARINASTEEEEEYDYDSYTDEELGEYLLDLYGGYDDLNDNTKEMYFDYDRFGRDLSFDVDTVRFDGEVYVFNSNYAKGGRLKEYAKGGQLEAFAVGGKIGSDITFNSWDEEKRSGTIVEVLDDGAYAVSVDTGMVLVYPKEVISYNKPVERKKLFGIFANGGRTNERKHVNKSEDYEVRYAKNHPHRTGYKGNQKYAKGGSIDSDREKMMDLLENKYNLRFVRTTEDFDGSRNGIWIAGDNSEELKGDVIFDYYNRSAKYTRGVLNTFRNAIEKLGWRFEWNDPATMMLYKDSDYEQGGSLKKKELTKGVEAFANGGEVRFVSNSEDKLSRPSLDIIDLMKKNQNELDSDLFVGNFGWKTSSNKLADGYLYKLDNFDKEIVKNFKLKPEETIYRFVNRTSAIAGMIPLIKINTEKGLLYFAKYNDSDEIIGFETKGIKASWLSFLSDKFAKGGTTDEEYIDLFEDHENIPAEVQEILDKHEKSFIDGDYKGLEQAHNELMKIGYTFEAYLDGVPYDLRPIGTKGKSEMYE